MSTFGAAPLSIPAALGISTITHYLTFKMPKNDPTVKADPAKALVQMLTNALATGLVFLTFGYVISRFL